MRQREARSGLRVPLALLLFGFASSSCWALAPLLAVPAPKNCAQGRPPRDCFPFFALQAMANTREVTIFGDANARSGIRKSYVEAAVAQWNNACREKEHMPRFVVDWEHDRPPFEEVEDPTIDPVYRTTILITFAPDEEAIFEPQTGRMEVAHWSPDDNSIKMFGKCGHKKHRKMEVPCEPVLDAIVWEPPWVSMIIAHEIGHALGLGHDLPDCKTRGLMQAVLDKDAILLILPEYCRLADDINNEHLPCSHSETDSDEHPCNAPPPREVPVPPAEPVGAVLKMPSSSRSTARPR